MLHEFLADNRNELIELCRRKVAARAVPAPTPRELDHGIPLFLDQLIATLERESRSNEEPGGSDASDVEDSATLHGRELMANGYTVQQVVHDYGDLCQAVTELAFDRGKSIDVDEFRTLNRLLDNAIAVAVGEYNYQRDFAVAGSNIEMLNQRLGFFAHELRNLLNTATLALTVLKAGNLGITGATGAVLDRSLVGLRSLIDRSLAEVRLTAGLEVNRTTFSVADFIAEVELSASLEADVRGCSLGTTAVDPNLSVDADRELLLSATGNLLQNAFKYTEPGTEVRLRAYGREDRVLIEVSDRCTGIAGRTESLFHPFAQASEDRSGLGLGLSISRRNVEANAGTLTAYDIPGRGCAFVIDLPARTTSIAA